MTIRPPFVYALVIVWCFFVLMSLWQYGSEIKENRAVLMAAGKSVSVTETALPAQTTTAGTGAALLSQLLEKSRVHDVRMHDVRYQPQQDTYVIECRGGEHELLAFYAWMEKEAGYKEMVAMELSHSEADEAGFSLVLSLRL